MFRRYHLVSLLVLLLIEVPLYADNDRAGEKQKSFLADEGVVRQTLVSGNTNPDTPILLSGDCSDYIDLSGQPLPIIVTGTTVGATNDYGPFPSLPACWQGPFDQANSGAGPDVTFKWTVPEEGYYTISLLGSSYDTGLLLYNFRCPMEPSLPEDFVCGCDDAWALLQSELFCLEFSAGQVSTTI